MADKVKVSVLEENSTELFENTERLLSSDIVDHDPTGSELVATDLKAAMDELELRRFGREFGYINQNPNFQTTSGTFVPALTLSLGTVPAGDYIMYWSYRANNSKSNTNHETQAQFNGLAVVTNVVTGNTTSVQTPLGGGLGEQFCGFYRFTVLNVNLDITLNIRRTAGNGAARINTMNLTCWRVS